MSAPLSGASDSFVVTQPGSLHSASSRPALRLCARSSPPGSPLHSGNRISSLRRIVMPGRVAFETTPAPCFPLAELVSNAAPPGQITRERPALVSRSCSRARGRQVVLEQTEEGFQMSLTRSRTRTPRALAIRANVSTVTLYSARSMFPM